jgi:hypothetical protein
MLNKDIRSLIELSINTPKPTKGLDVFHKVHLLQHVGVDDVEAPASVNKGPGRKAPSTMGLTTSGYVPR